MATGKHMVACGDLWSELSKVQKGLFNRLKHDFEKSEIEIDFDSFLFYLALGAKVRRATAESNPLDLSATARAGLVLLSVGGK